MDKQDDPGETINQDTGSLLLDIGFALLCVSIAGLMLFGFAWILSAVWAGFQALG